MLCASAVLPLADSGLRGNDTSLHWVFVTPGAGALVLATWLNKGPLEDVTVQMRITLTAKCTECGGICHGDKTHIDADTQGHQDLQLCFRGQGETEGIEHI